VNICCFINVLKTVFDNFPEILEPDWQFFSHRYCLVGCTTKVTRIQEIQDNA
jgi:hypothetical protein